jgi:hypothetical protein
MHHMLQRPIITAYTCTPWCQFSAVVCMLTAVPEQLVSMHVQALCFASEYVCFMALHHDSSMRHMLIGLHDC